MQLLTSYLLLFCLVQLKAVIAAADLIHVVVSAASAAQAVVVAETAVLLETEEWPLFSF